MKNILLILLLIGFILISGCGKKDEIKENVKDDKKSEEMKNDNTTSGEQKKDDSKDKSSSSVNDLGISEGLPKNYPSDIPQPKNSKCLGSLSSSEGTVVNFETSEKIKDLVDFYKDEMKKIGFTLAEGGDVIVSDDAAILSWKKGVREFSLIMSFDKEKSMSQIAMTYK